MNCQEFSEHAAEIARAAVMDAVARDAALGHADGCATCAARLERERALSAALRATAESFGGVAAPARVESALLAAFRAERDAVREPAAAQPFAPARVHTLAPRFGRRARFAFAASAVAASLILTFFVVRRAPQRQPEPTRQEVVRQSPATPPQSSASQTATNETSAQTSPRQTDQAERSAAGGEAVRSLNSGVERGRPSRVQRAAGGRSVKKSLGEAALAFNIDGGQAVFAEGDSAGASETAGLRGDAAALTDFVPISAGTSSAPLDGGQVVRVEAPRAALASLGLPVDARRANEMVKADLLLAHDGTAHAIRFVR